MLPLASATRCRGAVPTTFLPRLPLISSDLTGTFAQVTRGALAVRTELEAHKTETEQTG